MTLVGYSMPALLVYPKANGCMKRPSRCRPMLIVDQHPDTLTMKHNLAYALLELGRFDEAERIARDTLEARKAVVGPEHFYTFRNAKLLAEILDAKGERDAAEQLLSATLEEQRRRLLATATRTR